MLLHEPAVQFVRVLRFELRRVAVFALLRAGGMRRSMHWRRRCDEFGWLRRDGKHFRSARAAAGSGIGADAAANGARNPA